MLKQLRRKASFEARDQEGNTYQLEESVEVLDASSMSNPNGEIEGLRSIATSAGSPVNRLGKGKYQIVATGQILTSDSPQAP